jgi:hypothetical protein
MRDACVLVSDFLHPNYGPFCFPAREASLPKVRWVDASSTDWEAVLTA